MLIAAMAGVNYITCVGTLESTNLGAHALCLIDNEIIGRVERLLRGIEVNELNLAVEVIKRVGPDGNYLMEAHTQQHFRTEHFIPKLSDRDQLEVWEKGGRNSILQHADKEMKKILAAHRGNDLDPKLESELDRFVSKVKERTIEDYYAAEWEA
jgi:trimethylamine--corrinoid protein Co-methyltransferase